MTAVAAVDAATPPIGEHDEGLRFGRWLTLIVVVGAAWRLGYLFVVKSGVNVKLNDAMYYSIQASLNSEGSWFKDGLTDQPGAEHGMLTSLYLAPWSLGDGNDVFRQRFGLTLLGIVTVLVIGLAGRQLALAFGGPVRTVERQRRADRVGLVAAAIVAVYPNFWINDSVVMSETIVMLLVSISLLVAIAHHRRPSVPTGILLGMLAGLGALTRSEVVLFIPALALLSATLCRRRGQSLWPAVAILVAGVATLTPWSVYNSLRFHEPVFLSTNDGNTLLGANCESTYYDSVGGWDLFCLAPLPELGLGHEPGAPDASDRSKERRERALEFIGDHVDRLPVVIAARIGRVLDLYGVSSMVALDVGEEKAAWAAWTGMVSWWLIAPLAIAGWRILSRHRLWVRWWLAVPLVTVLVTTVLFYGAHRIRAPAEPAVVLLAAVAIVNRWDRPSTTVSGS